jgi:hypothetical protein
MNKRQRRKRAMENLTIIDLDDIVPMEEPVSVIDCIGDSHKGIAFISDNSQEEESIFLQANRVRYMGLISKGFSNEQWDSEFFRIFGLRSKDKTLV